MRFKQAVAAAAVGMGLLLGGCATTDIRGQASAEAERMKAGPQAAPFRTITGFSDALRCMDNLMIVYGVRDWPILVEDLTDHTKKINAGTKDMLISAISDASKRSRGIRLVTFGTDSGNLANFHANAESKRPYESIPLYDIRGSISQLDEGLYKKQIEGGITFGPVGFGAAKSGDVAVLALDLTVIAARDYSVIPGVTSRNSVVIYKEGSGVDGEAEYKKLGLNFGMTLTRSEGKAQALRSLVELSVVELIGKLSHTPYWNCLGADPASDVVSTEISDWFYAMSVNGDITTWAQQQMAVRGLYRGQIDGRRSGEFDAAVASYRGALGLGSEPLLDEAFFKAYLAADHRKIQLPAQPARVAEAKPAAVPAAPLRLSLAPANEQARFVRGEAIQLTVKPSADAHVYCYMQDENAQIRRLYPNRFARDSLVPARQALALPGSMRFQLVMNGKGASETVTCFATARDVLQQLPASAVGTDFEPLPVASLDQIRDAFRSASEGLLAQETLRVQPK
jgi:hypothetical protein